MFYSDAVESDLIISLFFRSLTLTALQLHRTSLNIHWKVLQIHWTGQNESQPAMQTKLYSKFHQKDRHLI